MLLKVCLFIIMVSAIEAATPTLTYFPQWQAKTLLMYKEDKPSKMTIYFDFTQNRTRLDATNPAEDDTPLGGPGEDMLIISKKATVEVEGPSGDCTLDYWDEAMVDFFYPFRGSYYVGYGFAPYVHRLGFHFANVSLGGLFYFADMWVDAFTKEYMVVMTDKDQDIANFVFEDFKPYLG
jgi:hypothetical protein